MDLPHLTPSCTNIKVVFLCPFKDDCGIMFYFIPNQDLFVVGFACHHSYFCYRVLENSKLRKLFLIELTFIILLEAENLAGFTTD